jgi:hypothetical protein
MRLLKIIKFVFSFIGLLMLCGAFFVYSNTQNFLESAVETKGRVVELLRSRSSDSTVYRPVVEFKTATGQRVEFSSSTGSNPPSYSIGETVIVLYQESSPTEAKIKGFFSVWGGAIILGILGVVFFGIGCSIIILGLLKNKKNAYLKQNGIPVVATFQSVEINGSFEVNGKNPYQIYAQWKNPATSELHIFKSENLWFDPSDHIAQDEITVLIHRDDPSKYYLDTSFLPKLSG